MSGTTLTQTQFALLSASVLQCLPEGITLDVADSWRGNHEELRARLAFLIEPAPEPKKKHKSNKQPPIIIDLDAYPFVPQGFKIEEHKKGGRFVFDSAHVRLYRDTSQEKFGIKGTHLYGKLKNASVMNELMLEWYLTNPQHISEEWKGKFVFFWGTIYRNFSGKLCVRCLFWSGLQWSTGFYSFGSDFRSESFAAVRAL